MLRIENLTKTYAGGAVRAVDSLSLSVSEGEIFGFIGPNGAGKSTTIKCMTGILNFEEGNISVFDHDMKTDAMAAKRLIGYVPDSHVIYEKLTGIEYINFICDIYRVSSMERRQKLDELLSVFSLENAIGNPIQSYSHGMKQKISVIAAIIHSPKLLVLDEPLTGLDPQSAYQLKEIMRKYSEQGNIVFFSSHVLDVVEKVCTRVGIIDSGKLVTACPMSELKERGLDTSLEELFLKITSKKADKHD